MFLVCALLGACDPALQDAADGSSPTADGGRRGLDGATVDGGAVSVDAARVDASDSGPELPSDDIPVVVVLGHGARTLVSCDEGESWVGDHSESADTSDHGPYSSPLLAGGGGVFVLGRGWGGEEGSGRVRRSVNGGFSWEGDTVGGGLTSGAFGEGVFVLVGSAMARRSTDLGVTWTSATPVAGGPEHADIGFGDGRFVSCGNGRCVYSDDGGVSWTQASVADGCGGEGGARGGVAYGNGVWVHAFGVGTCVSDDGASWTPSVGGGRGDALVFDGARFVRAQYEIHASDDGQRWERLGEGPERTRGIVRTPGGWYIAVGQRSIFRTRDFVDFDRTTPTPNASLTAVRVEMMPRPPGC